jgi:hypothetical protein
MSWRSLSIYPVGYAIIPTIRRMPRFLLNLVSRTNHGRG